MGLVLTGIVNSCRPIVAEDRSYQFVAMDIVTDRGVTYVCQMWDDDPQFGELYEMATDLPNHKVKVAIKNYAVGSRKLKSGEKVPQVRFRITKVRDLGIPDDDEE